MDSSKSSNDSEISRVSICRVCRNPKFIKYKDGTKVFSDHSGCKIVSVPKEVVEKRLKEIREQANDAPF